MTSDKEVFSIVSGSKLTVIRDNKPTEILAPPQLIAVYKGNLLNQEKEANERTTKATRSAKKQGKIWTAIGSLLSIIAAFVGKGALDKVKKK